MTLKKNTEYTVKLGINPYQGGGPRGGIHGGGGLAVIYEKARVLAVCGGGGGGGREDIVQGMPGQGTYLQNGVLKTTASVLNSNNNYTRGVVK